MSQSRKQVILTPQPGLLPDQYPGTDVLPGDDAIAIQDFITEHGGIGDTKVFLYRLRDDGKEAYLKEYVPNEFSWEDVQQNFGGGMFRIRGYTYDPDMGKRVLFINRRQLIETPGNKPTAPEAPPYREGNSEIALLVKAMSDGLVKLGELIVASRPVAATEMEMLEKMQLYKNLFAPSGSIQRDDAPLPMEQTMGVLREMLSFVKENVAGEGGDTGSGTLLMKAMDTFGKPLAELVMRSQAKAGLPAPVNNEEALALIPASAKQPQTEAEMLNFAIKKYINEMVSAAHDDDDPQPYAHIAMQKIPRAKAAELLNDPQWLNKLAAFNPAVLQYKDWFNELREIALEILTAPEQASDTDGQPSIESVHVPASTGGKSS